jgi:glycosyltransferase involved in cell wall biosynthesis
MLVCKAMGFPVTMHYMGPLDQYWERCGWIERMLVRRVLHVPAGFAVMSQRALRALLQITPGARAVVVPSSVDPHVYAHAASRLWDADGKVRMLFVGGQGPYRKGLHELLAAAKVLWSSDSPLVFIVTGPVAESAARQAGEWVGKNVLFTGTIPEHDMIALYHSVDVLVLPSHNEGLPYVVVEAMASGLPIISSTVGGLPEVIQHEETGLLVRPGDVQGLASAIAELVDDASKRKRMGDAGRSFAEAHLSSDACLAVLERFFDETLNRTPRVAAQDCNEN